MIECELCHGRILVACGLNEFGEELYYWERCQDCGHMSLCRTDFARIEEFTNVPLDTIAAEARKSGRPYPPADAVGQPSFW